MKCRFELSQTTNVVYAEVLTAVSAGVTGVAILAEAKEASCPGITSTLVGTGVR